MGQRIDMTESEIEALVKICTTISAAMCASLISHGIACPPTSREAIARAVTVSLTESVVTGRLSLSKFH